MHLSIFTEVIEHLMLSLIRAPLRHTISKLMLVVTCMSQLISDIQFQPENGRSSTLCYNYRAHASPFLASAGELGTKGTKPRPQNTGRMNESSNFRQ